jgi:chemotaxis protein methyltransferase CheR
MIQFGKRNLMKPLGDLDKFDVIFCRNVAVYFNREDRQKFYQKIANQLNPDGYLIIGSTESLVGLDTPFIPKEHLRTIFYQLRPQ